MWHTKLSAVPDTMTARRSAVSASRRRSTRRVKCRHVTRGEAPLVRVGECLLKNCLILACVPTQREMAKLSG